MSIKIDTILYLILFLLASSQENSLSEKKFTNLIKKMHNHKYISVDYIHNIYSPLRNKKRVIEGKAFFAKPSKFHWNKISPIHEEIIYDGSNLYIYNVEDSVIHKFPAITQQAKEIENLTTILLNPNKLLSKYKIIKINKKPQQLINIILKPITSNNINTIHFTYNLNINMITYLKIDYTDGKIWELIFTNHSNNPINEELFSIKRLSNIKIISIN